MRPTDDEHELISRARAGDETAWRALVEAYHPFMQRSIARYVRDDESARDCLAGLLEKLRRGALARFDFRSSFTTWLFIVIRNHCRDFHRGAGGVRHLMAAVEGLGKRERRYFILYYVQDLSIRETLESMRAEFGPSIGYPFLLECDDRVRAGAERGRLGGILDRLLRPDRPFPGREGDLAGGERPEAEIADPRPDDPGAAADARRLDEALGHLRDAIRRLPPRDRMTVRLRYVHGRSAREIAGLLGFENEKKVYHRLETLLERLRGMLVERGMSGDLYRELVGDMEELCVRRALREEDGGTDGIDGEEIPHGRPE